ncbi:MAG: EFR1 family ferrodoxin [Acutalibacteraceae bacterium]
MIFYFSGTGNTKYLAEKISERLGEKLIGITEALRNNNFKYEAQNSESVGFVIPVYFSGVPKCVREFIEKMSLTLKGDNYIFTALSCGGSTANAGNMLKKLLTEKGITVNAAYSAVMVDNYIPMFNIQTQEEADKKLKEVNPKIDNLTEKIAEKKDGDFDGNKGAKIMTALMYPFYKPMRKTKKFYVTDKCISCGKCESGCVDKAIEITNGKPVWVKGECTQCLRCIHTCPTKAIEFGKKTEKRNRFVNPYIQM